jgi:tetratricopeptide (TPR) repeat protein
MAPRRELAALLSELRDHLGYRRIEQGFRTLEQSAPLLDELAPETPGFGVLVGLIAQWVDAGFSSTEWLAGLMRRFAGIDHAALPFLDYLHLRMAAGVLAMAEEDYERATAHFRFVQSLEGEIRDDELMAIANFWTGRSLRRMGQYDDAATYIERGEELALSCGYIPMAAIMQATRSWLAFQKGKLHEAVTILRRAEEALRQTDDFPSRGNIQSAYGRIARRQGRYQRALEYFEKAIGEYRQGGSNQLRLARTLLNLAFVKRQLALDLQKEVDRASASRRTGAGHGGGLAESRGAIERIRAEARHHLEESMALYTQHHNHHGIAGVHTNSAFLHLDAGDLECAALESAEAFRYGEEKRDYIVMARARILQCIIENAAVDEQVGDPGPHREAAELFIRDAVNFAGQTQNHRLLARAYVWQGLTAGAEPDADLETARQSLERALALLHTDSSEKQYVWDDLEMLKSKVLHARSIDPTLRAWSTGVVEHQTFQQMTEEFARIVIPKVWEREGRKISRVAEKLSISPKKVRRILQSVQSK